MDLIQKKDLRDDHGELFGFGTHMFRHVYGIRLTELHLDDWTIAKLLGHALQVQAGMVDKRRKILDMAMDNRILQLEQQVAKLKRENETLRKENEAMRKALNKRDLNLIKNF